MLSSRSLRYLDGLNASLIARRRFNDMEIVGLLRRRSYEGDCRDREGRPTKLFRYREGQILIRKGEG